MRLLLDGSRELTSPEGLDRLVERTPFFHLVGGKKCLRTPDSLNHLALGEVSDVSSTQDSLKVLLKFSAALFAGALGSIAGVATDFRQTGKACADWHVVGAPVLQVVRVLNGPEKNVVPYPSAHGLDGSLRACSRGR